MVSQKPAIASSTELSTTSLTRWCRPRSPVEPMYIPGRLRTASRPSSTVMDPESYSVGRAPLPLFTRGSAVEGGDLDREDVRRIGGVDGRRRGRMARGTLRSPALISCHTGATPRHHPDSGARGRHDNTGTAVIGGIRSRPERGPVYRVSWTEPVSARGRNGRKWSWERHNGRLRRTVGVSGAPIHTPGLLTGSDGPVRDPGRTAEAGRPRPIRPGEPLRCLD